MITNTQLLNVHTGMLIPGYIEMQEKSGQTELVGTSSKQIAQLPAKGNGCDAIKIYEAVGIEIIGESKNDNLFLDVKLPEGWKIVGTDHSMWSHLLDDLGRKRGEIFYKAAFYDRDAFINFNVRVSYRVNRVGFLNDDYSLDSNKEYVSNSTPYCGIVKDFDGTVLFKTSEHPLEIVYNEPNFKGGYTRDYVDAMHSLERMLKVECENFLNANYPDFKSETAYWDDYI